MKSMLQEIDLSTINKIAVFSNLTEDDLQQVKALLRRKTFAAGAPLMLVEQSAEAVYGVTMQEPGVSTIVGVRLAERQAV